MELSDRLTQDTELLELLRPACGPPLDQLNVGLNACRVLNVWRRRAEITFNSIFD